MPKFYRILSIIAVTVLAVGCADFPKSLTLSKKTDKKLGETTPPPEKAAPPPAPRINPMTHIAAGQMLEKQGDLMGAIEQYEKAVATDPRQGIGYNRLGITYQKLGRLADAEQMFSQGVRAQPGSAMIRNNLGYTLLLQRKFSEAEKAFREALAVSRGFQRARMNLAITLVHETRLDDALAEFKQVLPLDMAHFNVAVVCMQKGDYANAEQALKLALGVNPNCPGARQQLDRLGQIAKANPKATPAKPIPPITPLAGDTTKDAGNTP
jgi:Flp pilus assembly protein TadD